MIDESQIKTTVKKEYGRIARQEQSSCCGPSNCCGSADPVEEISKTIGYSDKDIKAVPEGSNLGLGCGNPTALASLKEGETVLDLGSGAGFDSFLAAKKVGINGKVIGVDMTQEMIGKARENAKKGGYTNVEFRLGEIEKLPINDNSVDIIISNCVINLSPEKNRVFQEAFRVLKPGGRLMISDIALLKELPEYIQNDVQAYVGCVSGAIKKDEYLELIRKSGFQNTKILEERIFDIGDVKNTIVSIKVTGTKASENISELRKIEGA